MFGSSVTKCPREITDRLNFGYFLHRLPTFRTRKPSLKYASTGIVGNRHIHEVRVPCSKAGVATLRGQLSVVYFFLSVIERAPPNRLPLPASLPPPPPPPPRPPLPSPTTTSSSHAAISRLIILGGRAIQLSSCLLGDRS